ncbi:MAG: hypothetical protein ACO32I_06570, partial [Candidatus Limnocylindrus sp.]
VGRQAADLGRVAERLPHAFAHLAHAALRAAIAAVSSGETPERSDIQLRYPSPPRGALGRGT